MLHAHDFASVQDEYRLHLIESLSLHQAMAGSELQQIAALAADLTNAPTALVTLVDDCQLWAKIRVGSDTPGMSRETTFCDLVVRDDQIVVIEDVSADPRIRDNPHTRGADAACAYAGAPLRLREPGGGLLVPIGTLCVMDVRPRTFTPEQVEQLQALALVAERIIQMRGAIVAAERRSDAYRDQALALRQQRRTFEQAERMAMIGSWRMTLPDRNVTWSDGVFRIHELDPGTDISLISALDFYPLHARETVVNALDEVIATGKPMHLEVDFDTARGRRLRVRSIGELELEDGRPVAVTGLIQDITDRYRMERTLRRSANVDEVTRIGNRAAFNRELQVAIDGAARGDHPLTLLLIDLDGFKGVNDTHGHMAGDDILRAVGRRMRAPYLASSFAARLGGDEFAVILTDPALCRDAGGLVERLLCDLKMPVHTSAGRLPISGTIGYAEYGPLTGSQREFIHRADTALYEAKRIERGTARRYSGLLFRPGGHTRGAD
ncbi:diguanylate cyclase domain-containing protein [Sphingomonas sp. FW199]|uniref:diguanylate cyclase domain-containing protein n=1 Tax=Sphingomonas sp. FW199 TaxID=3400217 RepID=UPI003CE72B8D